MTSGPKVRLGTKWPSMTSHWMRSTPAFSRAATSSPSRAKSAGQHRRGDLDRTRLRRSPSHSRRSPTVAANGSAAGSDPVGVPVRSRTVAIVELECTSMAVGGEAVARQADGRVVFVAGALPGERVRVDVTDERKTFARGRVLDVLEAAPGRVTPPCPHVARGCGGCGWQHLERRHAALAQAQLVADSLSRLGGTSDVDVAPGPDLATEGYRTTLRLSTVDGRGRVPAGAQPRPGRGRLVPGGPPAAGRAGHRRAASTAAAR